MATNSASDPVLGVPGHLVGDREAAADIPVVVASQTSVPHASSLHASSSHGAASFAEGGDGFGPGRGGGCALPVG